MCLAVYGVMRTTPTADFEDISISKTLQFIEGAGLHEGSILVKVHWSLTCLAGLLVFYSVPF